MALLKPIVIKILANFGYKNSFLDRLTFKQTFFYSLIIYALLFLVGDVLN
jgi:hypothetical protein